MNVLVTVELKNKFLARTNCNIDKNLEHNCSALCSWSSRARLNSPKGKNIEKEKKKPPNYPRHKHRKVCVSLWFKFNFTHICTCRLVWLKKICHRLILHVFNLIKWVNIWRELSAARGLVYNLVFLHWSAVVCSTQVFLQAMETSFQLKWMHWHKVEREWSWLLCETRRVLY